MLRHLALALPLAALALTTTPTRAEPCTLATPRDCLLRGLELMRGDDGSAVGWFASACESKEPDACTQMGFLYMGHTPLMAQDDAQAFAFSKLGCDLGSGLGCANAAVLMRDGRGAATDPAAMRALAERGCTLKHPEGCYLAAAIHEEGVGTKVDLKKANAFLEKACDYEDARSCELLANRCLEGSHGVKRDDKKGAVKLERACELGSGEACNDLGAAIGGGRAGFPKGGHARAVPAFARGCELGLEKACNNLKLAQEAAAGGGGAAAAASEGTTALTLVARSGKKATVRLAGGAALVVGATGEVTKEVTTGPFTMNLVIGTVKVTKLTGDGAELSIEQDQSEIVVDGKKVDHWTRGTALELKWKAP